MSTAEHTFSGTKQNLICQRLLCLVLQFHSFSQIKTGVTELLPWMVVPFIMLILCQQCNDAKKLLVTMNQELQWILWLLKVLILERGTTDQAEEHSSDSKRLKNITMPLLIFMNSRRHSTTLISDIMLSQQVHSAED